jgi:D-amino-acid dehydrogenase
MPHILVIGAGITGVTTAYAALARGCRVTIVDRQRYAGMETSFANGGQLSACNAEVWNSRATLIKGLKWVFRADAPLLLNPAPSWHKYSWLGEFTAQIGGYRRNTIATTRLAIAAREKLFAITRAEGIDFDLEQRGILHIYRDKPAFEAATKVNELLREGGLDRYAVTPEEMRGIEPTLPTGNLYGGFFTPSDSTGDIHKFCIGLAAACAAKGATLLMDTSITGLAADATGVTASILPEGGTPGELKADAVVICAGIASRHLASLLGDRVNIYPVKGYSITVPLESETAQAAAPYVSLLDEGAKIVTSRLGKQRLRVAGTAEFNGANKNIRADRIQPLADWTRRLFPEVPTESVQPWAGLRPMMPDMMPRVARGRKPGVFYNTGHGHLGWTLSPATAELVMDQVLLNPA